MQVTSKFSDIISEDIFCDTRGQLADTVRAAVPEQEAPASKR